MKKRLEELAKKEEITIFKLHSAKHQVLIYLKQLNALADNYGLDKQNEQYVWFQQVFHYYLEDLIPAIEEIAVVKKGHLEIYDKNPDKFFKPANIEINNLQKLTNQFMIRLEQIHQEFNDFRIKARSL